MSDTYDRDEDMELSDQERQDEEQQQQTQERQTIEQTTKAAALLSSKKSSAPEKRVILSSKINHVCFPGDIIPLTTLPSASQRIRISPIGLTQATITTTDNNTPHLVATKVGVLRQTGNSKLWMDTHQKRYIPQVDDLVVGTIIEKHSESYKVDIGTFEPAILSAMAFEGATKRNKPNINVGGLVYCRVITATRHMETELSCTSPHVKKEWVTGQSLFGELQHGYLIQVSLSLARKLLDPSCFVLTCLGRHLPFELAIGMNGLVWLNSGNAIHTVLISNAITNSEGMKDGVIQIMVDKLVQNI